MAEPGDRVLLDQQDTGGSASEPWRFTSTPLHLEGGRYRLEIRDGERRTSVQIQFVSAEALPLPEGLRLITGDDLRETVYATWLAAQGEPWMMEAYERAVALEDRHPPARVLRYSLEQGVYPAPPPEADATAEPAAELQGHEGQQEQMSSP